MKRTPTRRTERRSRIIGWLGLLCLSAVALSGCGLSANQKASIQKFSVATATLGDLARKEFVQSRADIIEMNTLAVNLGSTQADPKKLDEFFTLQRVALRTAACDAIREYGQLLQTLATTDTVAELKLARDEFVGSLKTVKALKLDDAQTGVIGQAIELVGGAVIETYRRERVTTIVQGSSKAVREIIGLLKKDFNLQEQHWQTGYNFTADRLISAGQSRTPASGLGKLPAGEAALIQSAATTAAKNVARRDAAVGEIASACVALEAAEKELLQVVRHPELSMGEIDAFFEQVARVESLIKVLNNE